MEVSQENLVNELKRLIENAQQGRTSYLEDAAKLVRDPDKWGPIMANVERDAVWTGEAQEMRSLLQDFGQRADSLGQEASRLGQLLQRAEAARTQTELKQVVGQYVANEAPGYGSAESFLRNNPRLLQASVAAEGAGAEATAVSQTARAAQPLIAEGEVVIATVEQNAPQLGWGAWLTYQASRAGSALWRAPGMVVRGVVSVVTTAARAVTWQGWVAMGAAAGLAWGVNKLGLNPFDSPDTSPPREQRPAVHAPLVPGEPGQQGGETAGAGPGGEGPAAPEPPNAVEPGQQGGGEPGGEGPAVAPAPEPPPPPNQNQPAPGGAGPGGEPMPHGGEPGGAPGGEPGPHVK